MSINVSGYVEVKDESGKWVLATDKPICSRLKYVIDNYTEFPRLKVEDLSEGLQSKYQKDENGETYASFYVTTISDIETDISTETKDIFTKLNVIVEALGADKIYSDFGDEVMCDSDSKEKMTLPINKTLVDTLQYGYDRIRKVGQKEAFDLFANEYVDYGQEHRIVLVVS